ncbi:MAG: hypothetical protein ACYC2I_08830 [Elusimicrobiales bacterium]
MMPGSSTATVIVYQTVFIFPSAFGQIYRKLHPRAAAAFGAALSARGTFLKETYMCRFYVNIYFSQ